MATTTYFEENIVDQGGEHSMALEFGRSSYYSGSLLKDGKGEHSIYIKVVIGDSEETVIMDRDMAKKFVEAAQGVGHYFSML